MITSQMLIGFAAFPVIYYIATGAGKKVWADLVDAWNVIKNAWTKIKGTVENPAPAQ